MFSSEKVYLIAARCKLSAYQIGRCIDDTLGHYPLPTLEEVSVVADSTTGDNDAPIEQNGLSINICEDEWVSWGRSGCRVDTYPAAGERVERMQVSKLRIIAAASEHVDFILVDG